MSARNKATDTQPYRLLKHALELRKPVMMLNIGPTRGDDLPLEKIEVPAGLVMRDVARDVMCASSSQV